jgi:predicted transposase/invertase (TIGR01784 family)
MTSIRPSDKFIRKIFSKKQEVIDFFKKTFPPALVEQFDWENITFGKENFVGLEWDESRTDQLYRLHLKTGSEIYIYILFEHKSYYDPKIYIQLLEYISKIYRWQLENEKELKVVLPLVFYHGEKDWDLGYTFQGMFNMKNIPEELLSYIPNFKIQLFELKSEGKEFETENLALYLFLRLIQIIRDKGEKFEGELLRLFTILSQEKEEAKRVEILLEMVKYLLSTRKDAERYKNKDFYKLLEAEYMTVLDEILAEGELRGIEKGFEKGIEKGKLETAKNMKAEGIELSVILKVTGLTDEQLKDAGIL